MTLLFNTLAFFVFFLAVYSLYLIANHRWQNRLLLVASYVFYGSWDWRFLGLLFFSTVVDFVSGWMIGRSDDSRVRKWWLTVSIVTNLGLLGFFKYFNFFVDSFTSLAGRFGWTVDDVTLRIILPVGISFYTFQTMSYTIDVFRRRIKPTTHFFDFALFVSFFPQLVAGPIERARHLLPQILAPRRIYDQASFEGVYLIGWGLFKKVVIADTLATFVDPVFAAPEPYSGALVLLALYAFAWQIYGDFSGYSDIARGLGKLMGFDLMINFEIPYFARNPRDFWRRWHISLSTWLRDYLYIPLGGNRLGKAKTIRNLGVTMVLGGLWHGAAWTFVVWGAYHGLLLIVHRFVRVPAVVQRWGRASWRGQPGLAAVLPMVVYFHLTLLGWLLFRAQSLKQVWQMVVSVVTNFDLSLVVDSQVWLLFFLVTFLLAVQWRQWRSNNLLFFLQVQPSEQAVWLVAACYVVGYMTWSAPGADLGGGQEFIYFQF